MKIPTFLVDQMTQKQPVLIVDKSGGIGMLLAETLKHEFLPVLVSGKKPSDELLKSVIYIPFVKKPPKIPENNFPFLFYVGSEDRYVRGALPPLISYAEKHGASLNVITSIYNKKPRQFDDLCEHPQVTMFVLGDLFGGEYTTSSVIGPFLLSGKYKQEVRFPNHGLCEMFPVRVTDAVHAIVRAVYSPESKGRVYTLYPTIPLTGLSLSRQLLHLDSDIRVDFFKTKRAFPTPQWFVHGAQALSVPPLEKQIQAEFSDLPTGSDKEATPLPSRISVNLPAIFLGGLSVFLVLLLPFFAMLFLSFSGAFLTQQAIDTLENQEFAEARSYAVNAQRFFGLSSGVSESLGPLSEVVGRGVTLRSFQDKLETAQDVDGILIDVSHALEIYASSQDESDRNKAKTQVTSAINRLKQAFLGLLTIETEGRMPQDYRKRLTPYMKAGEYFLGVSDVLPSVLGYSEKRTYLLLFQNNNELRPGGGFIGSYGLMEVDRGKITNVSIHDVYDADGQLTSHVEPPFPLREYMGVSHWYLRDSNFAIDFPENAARAAFFLKLETGEIVDGVIGLDTVFIANLLDATGPIDVTDFDETITAENFAEKTQREIEEDFFPGSQKKKQFLSAFYDELSQTVLTEQRVSPPLFLRSLTTSLEEKHVLFAFAKESDQTPFTVSNLSGALWDERDGPEVEHSFFDYLGTNEANLGENKVNAFIERHIKHDVALSEDGVVSTRVAISYTNTSTKDSAFGGVYKNYMRFVLPREANAVSLSIGGEEKVMLTSVEAEAEREGRGPVSRDSVSVDRGEEKGKQTVGFLVEIPPEETLDVVMEFEADTSFEEGDPEFYYDLKLLKQPGREADPYSLTFSYPQTYQVVQSTDELKGQQQSLTSFFLLNTDRQFTVLLGEK